MKNNATPEVRFEGFEEDWEEKTLGEIGNIFTGNTPRTDKPENYSKDGVLWITPTDIFAPVTKHSSRKLSQIGTTKARIVPSGSVLVTCIASIGKNTLVLEESGFNQQINAIVPNKEYNSYFVLMLMDDISKKMLSVAGAGIMNIVKKSLFMSMLTKTPSNFSEQQKIGEFFKNLDKTIAITQKELSNLKQAKKGFLQKMFPKNGEKKPEVRFEGFETDWEEKTFSDISSVYDGTHQTPEYKKSGIMFLSVEDIKTLKSKKYISKEAFEKEFKVYPEKGDVLMTRIGDVGTTNVVQSDNLLAYYVSLALFKLKDVEPYFLSASIASPLGQKELWKKTLHIAFPKKINKNELEKVEISVPSLEEQQKIGEFFKNLDELIAIAQKELSNLQQAKKAFLQKMFV